METRVTVNPGHPILTAATVWPRCFHSTVAEGCNSSAWPSCEAGEGLGTYKTK